MRSLSKRRSSIIRTVMRAVVASILASVLSLTSVLASSSSSLSLLSITGDLAPSLLPITLIMLVAGSGVAAAANYSVSQLQAMMLPGARGPNADLYARLGLSNGPSPRHLNPEMLFSRLGADFNSEWMSVEKPSPRANPGPADVDTELLENLRELSFSYTDEHGDRRTMPSAVRSIVERWMLQRATCQVRYTWDDMGVLFWPRWVKHGHCDTEAPCSWPPGMHCAAAESDTLRLLHWQCRRSDPTRKLRHLGRSGRHRDTGAVTPRAGEGKAKRSGKMQCRWKKVPYPVTSECFCSC